MNEENDIYNTIWFKIFGFFFLIFLGISAGYIFLDGYKSLIDGINNQDDNCFSSNELTNVHLTFKNQKITSKKRLLDTEK